MKLVKAYNSVSLVLRIVIGMAIGTALALLIPNAAVTAPGIGILGNRFHHRRHSGLARDCHQLLVRCAVHRRRGVQAVAQKRQGDQVLSR